MKLSKIRRNALNGESFVILVLAYRVGPGVSLITLCADCLPLFPTCVSTFVHIVPSLPDSVPAFTCICSAGAAATETTTSLLSLLSDYVVSAKGFTS
jgi:hypothetical protein